MAEDWKLLTILIGANDACDNCDLDYVTPVDQVVDAFAENFKNALNLIYEKFPRTLVNVVLQFNVSLVYDIAGNISYCADLHKVAFFECPCAFAEDITKR